jgi:hypothetical protein
LRELLIRLQKGLEEESRAAEAWRKKLNVIFQEESSLFLNEQRERFQAHNHPGLKREIRHLFSKHDPFRVPRQMIRQVLTTPLRLMGLVNPPGQDPADGDLRKIRRKTDILPLQSALNRFNRSVLERLSPENRQAPLFPALRETHVRIRDREILTRLEAEQDRLDLWLKEAFQELIRTLPRGKRLGIISVSALWGALLVIFEIIVGGGFTMIDAILDAVFAPFITKGASELFAYREIRRISRQLAKAYEQALLSILEEQKKQYERVLDRFVMSPEELKQIKSLYECLKCGVS